MNAKDRVLMVVHGVESEGEIAAVEGLKQRWQSLLQTYEFDVITGSGMKSSQLPSLETKGVAVDRYMRNELNYLQREQMMSPQTTPWPQSKSPAAFSQS